MFNTTTDVTCAKNLNSPILYTNDKTKSHIYTYTTGASFYVTKKLAARLLRARAFVRFHDARVRKNSSRYSLPRARELVHDVRGTKKLYIGTRGAI